ncbi:MAG TPA: CHAD domain-containing protein [Euzebyales bacterium]
MLRGVDPTSGALRESLVAGIGLRRDGRETVERRLLDSFDWRVWDAGAVLEHDMTPTAAWLTWRRRATSAEPARVLGRQASPTTPSTAADLAGGPVTRLLAPVLGLRALLPRAEMRVERELFSLRDGEDKSVARAAIEHITVTGPGDMDDRDLGWRVVVTGVRGYDDVLADLVDRLEGAPGLVAGRDDADRSLFESAGAQPADYSSKLRVAIEPEAPTLQALSTICSTLLDTIEVNERGVRDDIDTEFLHDFRVAIRRTRSMLSQAGEVIPETERRFYGDAFRWLAGETSELRDLDVYLLGFDDLTAQLPAEHRADVEPLRDLLEDLRRDAYTRLMVALDSQRYRELMASWRAFLDAPDGAGAASTPVGRTAGERIWKAYRSIVRHGRHIDDDSPAEAVHDLRKRAKKLRYLLEAYRSLYPRGDMRSLTAELVTLQDNLGTYQDCDVQISSLRRFAELLGQRPGATGPAVLAMGVLSSQLAQRQQQARAEFQERFARFDRRKNRQRFRRLFEPIAEPVT